MSATFTVPEADDRARWLAYRRDFITASDVAAILGEDEHGRTALSVYAEKVEGIDTPETTRMRRGRLLEPVIAEEFRLQTGHPVFEPRVEHPAGGEVVAFGPFVMFVHPAHPWLAATLDRETQNCVGQRIPLELKAVLDLKAAREWEGDAAPLGYEIQAQIQAACTGAPAASLCGFIPHEDELAVRDRPRDDAFLEAALPVLEEFRDRVRTRRPPEADGLPGSSRAVRRLWGRGDGETVPLDHEALALAEAWEGAKARRHEAEGRAADLENKLRLRIGGATFGALPDGSFLTLKPFRNGRVLRRWYPRLKRR